MGLYLNGKEKTESLNLDQESIIPSLALERQGNNETSTMCLQKRNEDRSSSGTLCTGQTDCVDPFSLLSSGCPQAFAQKHRSIAILRAIRAGVNLDISI